MTDREQTQRGSSVSVCGRLSFPLPPKGSPSTPQQSYDRESFSEKFLPTDLRKCNEKLNFSSVSCTQCSTRFFSARSAFLKHTSADLYEFELNPAWQIGKRAREAVLSPFPPWSIGNSTAPGTTLGDYLVLATP